jgi:hypothetical protein
MNETIKRWNSLTSAQRAQFGDAQFASPQRSLAHWNKDFESLSPEKQRRILAQKDWLTSHVFSL